MKSTTTTSTKNVWQDFPLTFTQVFTVSVVKNSTVLVSDADTAPTASGTQGRFGAINRLTTSGFYHNCVGPSTSKGAGDAYWIAVGI